MQKDNACHYKKTGIKNSLLEFQKTQYFAGFADVSKF